MEELGVYDTFYKNLRKQAFAEGFAEGAIEQARKSLLLLGNELFGAPGARARTAVEHLALEELEELVLRVHEASSWEELLGLPAKGRGRKR